MTSRWSTGWRGVLLLMLLGFVVFGNAFDAPFHYDDLHSIKYNPHIRTLAGIPDHFVDPGTFSSRVRGFMYRPVLMTSYSVDYAMWGSDATGFRFGNLLLHVIASALFGLLMGRWNGSGGAGAAVGLGGAPAVEQIAASPVLSTSMTLGLSRRGRVVDDPELAEVPRGEHDLIEVGVVGDRVDMVPVAGRGERWVVEVDELGVIGDDAVVGLCRIEVLDEVIPGMPLPDDVGAA